MLKKVFKTIDRTFAAIEDWSLFLTVCLALIVAMANVVLRKTTDINLYWSDEVVRKVIFFTTFVGGSAAVRHRALIRIDALPQMLPILKRSLTLFSHLTVLGFSFTMIWLGTQLTLAMRADEYARTPTLQIPEWYFYAVLPLVGVTMLLRTLVVMVEDWRGEKGR